MQRRLPHTTRLATAALALSCIGAVSCGADETPSAGGPGSSTATSVTTSAPSPTSSTTTTEAPRVSTPAPSPDATFQPASGDLATTIVGKTIAQARTLGFEVHQQSAFGRQGEWSLFTVEHEGRWMVFTTKNVHQNDDASYYLLDDDSQIVGGQTLDPLPEGDWYGVEGVTRNGKPTGGVMMQAHGYDREADGTFPVRKAFRINLTTLRLDEAPTAGLDVEEPCG